MNVGVISPEFPPEIGGVETYAYEFTRELANRGHDVTVFTRPHAQGEAPPSGVRVVPALKLRREADRVILRDTSFDVWHVMNAAYAWVALEASPVIVSVHGNDFLQPYLPVAQPDLGRLPGLWRSSRWHYTIERTLGEWLTRRLVRRSLPRASHILANSCYTEQVLLEKIPACRGLTSAAMVGVSPEFLGNEMKRTTNGHSKLITVCRLADPRKNVDLVLKALATLKDQHHFSYTVVGDGPLRPTLENLTRELGLAERVCFVGFVDSVELRRLLSDSDLFVLTSSVRRGSHEGFGIAYLEANACGTPVLAARLAGAVEAVAESVSGFFVDTPSTESIAAGLRQFLGREMTFDPSACRAFAARFSWRGVTEHALSYYLRGT